ncbi:MAG: DNA polymerase IV [Flavobacteriaceae bacterium]|nr:DNA polymerase IV [Flavobacteriaceae bacterium]
MTSELDSRKIIHVDMDAFYASVEQLDNPKLRDKPVAVGGGEKRGVVAAASYEARKYGVRSAMTGFQAKKNCPDLIFVKPRFERYREISKQIRSIFYDYTDLVEPLSLDEAYLDVTQNRKGNPSATLIASEIRQRIWEEVQLTASAGISINKFIAKVASDINKPNGQKTVGPNEVIPFLEELDIRKFYGVGKVTAEKMYKLGIFKGKDLKNKSLVYLVEHFGKSGRYYYDAVRGIHKSKVSPDRIPKSVGAERTFAENISSEIFLLERLEKIAAELHRRIERHSISGKTVTLKIRYSDFSSHTRSKTLTNYINTTSAIMETVKVLLYQEALQDSVRLVGITLSNLNTQQKSATPESEEKEGISVQLEFDF